jgi:hypothetical protein
MKGATRVPQPKRKKNGPVDRFLRGNIPDLGTLQAVEAVPAPEPVEVPADEGAYKDFENGRKRIVILLTEDGKRIEPVRAFGGLPYILTVQLIQQVAETIQRDITAAFLALSEENDLLKQNIAFLESKAPPAPGGPVPVPRMDNGQVGG